MDLISAAKNGDFESAFSLLQNDCSTSIRDKDSATPLYWSACHGHTNICELLIEAGSDVNARVTWGSTPLHAAADRSHNSVIEVLIDSGADVNAKNNRGDTALHIASYRGHKDEVMTLLRAKADVTIRNEKGKSPQQEAMEGGHRVMAETIVEYANVHQNAGARKAITPDELVSRNPPEIRISSVGRRKSECTISYRTPGTKVEPEADDPDYENSERRPSVPGPLPTFRQNSLDIPPPRPPISRSTSFSGNHGDMHNTADNSGDQRTLQLAARTNSVGCIPYDSSRNFLNDVSKTFASSEYVNHVPSFSHQDSLLSQTSSDLTDTSAYSSDASWRTPSMTSSGGTEAMECSDYSVFGTSASRAVPDIPPRLRVPLRPQRLSIGSMKDIGDSVADIEFVKTLNKQLVESYKQTEKLATENETLKFKCSTLLGRLTDTEQLCNMRSKECESLKELVDAKCVDLKEKDIVIQTFKDKSVHPETDTENNGFNQFSERLNKTLSDGILSELQEILRDSLQTFVLNKEPAIGEIDAPHREWVPGVDYVILGRQHVHEKLDVPKNGPPKHVLFLIKHLKTGRRLVLKMLLRFRKRGDGQTGATWLVDDEIDIMERLCDQPNVVKILHSYESSTERFKKFISVPLNGEELCSRTTFIVTEQMMTLAQFTKSISEEVGSELITPFLLHSFYQLLSVLCVLEELGIEHNNINEETLFVSDELRPTLGGFELASFSNETKDLRPHNGSTGQDIPDYENVEHLARGSQMHRLPRNFARRNNDLFALGKVFDNVLLDDCGQAADDVMWPTSSVCMTSLPPIVWQVLNGIITSYQNYSSRECLHRVGYSLFGPCKGEVSNQFQTRTFMQTLMFKLLSSKPASRSMSAQQPGHVSIANAINRNCYEIEAHFLCNITAQQIWDMYYTLEKDNLLSDSVPQH